MSIEKTVGSSWKSEMGTRQGGILSPLLFNFYLKDCIDEVTKLNVGCNLGSSKCNILAYADDLILIAPSAQGLQHIVNNIGISLSKHKLLINNTKSKYIVFKYKNKLEINSSIVLNGVQLERVYEYKYLGIILMDNMSNNRDSDRIVNSFLGQFNSLYYKFNFASQNVLTYLFKTYCSSFYGIELWYNDSNRKKNLYKTSVAYHKAIKRIVHLNSWDSNHLGCELVGVNIFKHLQAKRMFNFYRSVLRSKNHFINKSKYYWNSVADIKSNIERIFVSEYDVTDVFNNDADAILSRIDFVERNEPRMSFLNIVV